MRKLPAGKRLDSEASMNLLELFGLAQVMQNERICEQTGDTPKPVGNVAKLKRGHLVR